MSKVSDLPAASLDDYNITLTESELKALRTAVRDADGRKSETKIAREVLGIRG